MKNYLLISLTAIAAIIIFFASNLTSQDQPTNVKAFNSSINKEKSGDYNGAISELQKVYSDYKSDYLFNLRLGWLYYANADFNNSKKYYSTAEKINPSSVEAKLGLVFPLAALNQWDEVKRLYGEIIKLDFNNYTANLRLGQILLNSSDFPNAKTFLEKVYKLYPGEYEPNLSLGYTYYYLGNNQKAKTLLTNALMLSPKDSLATAGLKLVK